MSILTPPVYPTITVGIREPKKVKVYPLSFADARKLKMLVMALITGIVDLKKDGFDPIQIASHSIALIEENIGTIANMVLEEPITEEELSLEQATELADMVYTMNEGAVKNLLRLWKKVRNDNQPKAENQ